MSLRKKTIKGLFWSAISQSGKQVSQFVVTAVLAHILSPDDFGLLAMATVFVNFAMIFGEMGISSALIQKQDTHDSHYYSAFWLNVVTGAVLTLIFMSLSPLIAWFYKKPQLQPILMVISINFFISSFVVIQQMFLTKEMDFKKLAVRDILAVVIAGIVGIYLAYHGFGVWSLVYQSIIFTLLNAILLWIVSPWRPKFSFAIQDIKDIFHFSANLTGFNIVNYFSRNIDQLLIGKFLGAQALGYYSLAYKIMLYPLQNISWVIAKVMFPAFSKIQNDLEKVRNTYLKMVKGISLITFPLMTLLFILAPEFVQVFLGQKWEPIIMILRIFCICGLFQSIGTTVGMIYLSLGRADMQFKLQFLGTALVTICVLIGLKWGINGVAFCYTLQSFFWINANLIIISKLTNLNYKSVYLNLKIPFIVAIGAATPLFFLKRSFTAFCIAGLFLSISCWVLLCVIMLVITREVIFKNRIPTLTFLND